MTMKKVPANVGREAAPDVKVYLGLRAHEEYLVHKDGKDGQVLKGPKVLKESRVLKDCVGGKVCVVLQACLEETGRMEHQERKADVDVEEREVGEVGEAHGVREVCPVRRYQVQEDYRVKGEKRASEGHRVRRETRGGEDHKAVVARRVEEDPRAKEGLRARWDHLGREGQLVGRDTLMNHGIQGGPAT
ncbi:hypothetical protein SLS63_003616 [Diaporthe eres]|uniref:Uncharacterized protein n=1 Tax=Diaporthe eres TaxID=83184 RepID=A0ABR1PGC9_DIAER